MVVGLLMMLYVLSLEMWIWDVGEQIRRSWEWCRNSGAGGDVGTESFMGMTSVLVGSSGIGIAVAVVACVPLMVASNASWRSR